MTSSLKKESQDGALIDWDSKYESALNFFRERSPVIFVSQHYRFWEQHGFVQQSLAKHLVDAGIEVYWFDGAHWKKNKPVKIWDSPLLRVSQLPSLPFRRVSWMDLASAKLQFVILQKILNRGNRPLLWVQSGLDERVVEQLPYVDVFSVFDDPYLHAPQGTLCQKSKLIVVQNNFARRLFDCISHKTMTLYPPVDMSPENFSDDLGVELASDFPSKIMGYIGSFFSEGFDLILFEDFVRSFPQFGFVLCGRTDSLGLKKIEALKNYKNFSYIPWVPRNKIGALWKKLQLNLMLYRPTPNSDGAFPVKFLEALHYGVPSLTTQVPKTSSLEGFIPRLLFPEQLKAEAERLVNFKSQPVTELYKKFSMEMHPKFHLIQIAKSVQDRTS